MICISLLDGSGNNNSAMPSARMNRARIGLFSFSLSLAPNSFRCGDKTLSDLRVVGRYKPRRTTIVIVLTPRIIAPPRFSRRACTKHGSFEYWPIHTQLGRLIIIVPLKEIPPPPIDLVLSRIISRSSSWMTLSQAVTRLCKMKFHKYAMRNRASTSIIQFVADCFPSK